MAITRGVPTKNIDAQKGFPYDLYFRGRKTARKSKPPRGTITLKKAKKTEPHDPISSSSYSSSSSKKSGFKAVKETEISRDVMIPGSGSVADYQALDVIGHGSYGIVYRARDTTTGEIVAVKKEFAGMSPSSLSEIEILKSVSSHPCIVDLKKVAVDGRGGVYIVMEHVENDLRRYMRSRTGHLAMDEVKLLMKQLIEGVKFLHDNHVMHRDLKPSNILVTSCGELKICDFGLSCRFPSASGSYSPRVGTLWYRAPELLLGDESYWSAIDMWSVGCIMGELVLKEALFRGRSDCDQIDKIFGENVIRRKLCLSGVPLMKEVGFDLLERLLTCNPEERITAESALNHAWFKER